MSEITRYDCEEDRSCEYEVKAVMNVDPTGYYVRNADHLVYLNEMRMDRDVERLRADTAEACLEEWRRSNHGNTVLENMDLREKLATAEQRNVDLLGLLRDTKTMLASELSYELYHNIAVHMKRIDAALNPDPEAESHE